MRQAILTAPRTFELRDAMLPDPGPGEVLIRVACCAVCGCEFPAYLVRCDEDEGLVQGGSGHCNKQ